MTQITAENKSLPAPIEATLRGLIRRVRLAIIVRGVLGTLAAAILGMLASMGIAVGWLPAEPWQHYALTFLWLAAAATAALVWLVRPLAKSFSLAGIARVIEQRHPELQERISSTVELLGSGDSPEIRGSQVLIDALAAEAVGDARTVRPKREITFRKVRPPLYVLVCAVAVVVVLLAIYPKPMGRLLAKTVAPYLNLPNVYADDLRITPGDCVLAEGMRLEVTVSVLRNNGAPRAKVRSARLRIERTGGTKNIFDMTALPEGSFVYTSCPLSADGPWGEKFRYRIGAGDARSQYYRVKVVPRPAGRSIEVGYEYPDYMHRPDAPMLAGSGRITGPAGAVATVRIRLNKPAADAELTINETAAEITQADPLTCAFSHNLTKDAGGKWKLLLIDEYGFRSDPLGGEIIVRPDTPPKVRILRPTSREKLKLRPTDRLGITADLADDFGVSRADLLISIDGRERKTIKLNVAAKPDRLGLTLQTAINLASLDLTGARRVTFRVRAWDNLPETLGGPQEGTSQTRTIELDVKAPVYAFQVQLALDIRLREALRRIYEHLKAAGKISEPLRRSMPGTKKLTGETTDKIDRMRESLLTAEETSRSLAELAAGAYPKVSAKLTKLTDDHIGRARELAGLVKITDAQKQRGELADEADFQIDRALAVVSELLKELHVLTDLAERAVALEELARQQEELAAAKGAPNRNTSRFGGPKTPATHPAQKGVNELSEREWQQAQRQVAADTAEMVRRTPRAMHEALKAKGKQTTDLAAMAKQLQRSQQALAKSTDDEHGIAEMKKQLKQLAAEQAKLARQISRMARQSHKVAPTTAPATKAFKATTRAACALTTTQPASAPAHQADAVKALEQTARRAAAELTGKLARTQARRRGQELTRLRAEQKKIARQAAKLSDNVKAQAPQPDRIDTHAVRSAAEAFRQLAGNRLPQAAKSANKAAGELGELAKRLGSTGSKPVPPNLSHTDAESRGKLAGKAGQLAQRQRQAGRQIADLAARKMSQVLAGRQGQIAEQTKKTGEDVELLEEHIAELLPDARAKKLVQSAAKSLRQATAAQGKAGRAMSSGRPGQSIPSQQASARALSQAATALARLGRQFAAQARKNSPAPAGKGADDAPGQLAEAYDAAQSAAQNQSAGEAAKAARLLAELAKQALQQAKAMGITLGAMGTRGMGIPMYIGTLNSDARIGTAGTDLRAGELTELGISADDWARLPGRLQDQVLQAARTSGPEEYRTLIKRYFRALAKKAAEKNSNWKEEKK